MAQPTRQVGFATIPAEVRAKILQYILPEYTPTTSWDQCVSQDENHRTTKSKAKDGRWEKATPAKNHHSILLVEKQLSAEAKRLIHRQSFQVSIQEGSETLDWMVADLRFESCGIDVNASWLPAYPGLDLSQIRDFTVRVVPSNWPYFWARAHSAFTTLCETRLLPDSPLKRVRIVLTDMVGSLCWTVLVDWRFSEFGLQRIAAALEDYEKALDIFSSVAALALECEVHLPFWVEHHPESGRVLEKWQGKLGARIFFDPNVPATSETSSSSGKMDDNDELAEPLDDVDIQSLENPLN